jgi:predicted ArsR family transcriptional regulator
MVNKKNPFITKLQQIRTEYESRLLGDKAVLANLLIEKLGPDSKEMIIQALHKGTRKWTEGIAREDIRAGRKNDIQGIIRFLWEPLPEQGFEYTYEKTADGVLFHVTKCPIADLAKKMNLCEWGYVFSCCSDYYIVEGYNKNIGFKRTKTIMQGDDYCDHFYYNK